MGLFKPKTTITIEGIIDRIGIVYTDDMVTTYGLTLVGDSTRYTAQPVPLDAVWELALARPGDEISFRVTENRPNEVHSHLVMNTTRVRKPLPTLNSTR